MKKRIFFFLIVLFLGNIQIVSSKSQTPIIEKTETETDYYYKVEDPKQNIAYSWKTKKEANSKPIKESLSLENDLKVSIEEESNAKKNIHRLTKEEKIVISFTKYGTPAQEITLELPVTDKFQEGEKLYLYYYNKLEDQIEFVQNNIAVKNGKSKITVLQSADYFLTNKRIKNAKNNPKQRNYIIIGLVIISFLLLLITFLEVRKK